MWGQMKNRIIAGALLYVCFFCVHMTIVHADQSGAKPILKGSNQQITKDIAFTSVMGSRPDAKSLRGFQKAILYNAQGAKVKEITFNKNDSIYSLDKMLQENSTKGPLFIKMLR
jgi:hypothetical protein